MSDLYPEGRVPARCVEWALTETNSGAPQVFLRFKALDGSEPPPYFGSFSEKALVHTLKALRACGWTGADVTTLDDAHCGLDANEVSLVVAHEVYEGVTRAKTKWVNAPGAALTPLDPAKKASFAAQLKGQILALEQGKPSAPAPKPNGKPAAPPPGHPADADIPF